MSRTPPNPAPPLPQVTVGVPVYNGEKHLGAALDSLLAQSFTDFELVISDNASTDGTQAICERYAARDARIRYIRQPVNLGAARNWNYLVEVARAPFFRWASANDLTHPEMLARCMEVMLSDERVVLCYGTTVLIAEDGAPITDYLRDPAIPDETPSARFIRVRQELSMNNAQSGLIRTSALRRTRLDRSYPAGDMVMMAELALYGTYRKLDEKLFFRRMSRESASKYLSPTELAAFIKPGAKGARWVVWQRHLDYLWSVLRSSIGGGEKLRCLAYTARAAYWERRELWRELAGLPRLSTQGSP